MLALSIFPGSHPPSIVDADELNFCVRDGNRWTLIAINTNLMDGFKTIVYVKAKSLKQLFKMVRLQGLEPGTH